MSNTLSTVTLTPQQEKLWDETRVALMWHMPAFSYIFYEMMDKSTPTAKYAIFTDDVPIAATDGSSLMLNPATFFKYTLGERIFICAHEILHCVLNHCIIFLRFARSGKITYPDGVTLPYHHELMNVAADLVINDMLIVGSDEKDQTCGTFNTDWLHDRSIATANDSVIDAYRKLFKKAGGKPLKSGQSQGQGQGQGQNGPPAPGRGDGTDAVNGGKEAFDKHLDPGTSEGKSPGQAEQERNDAEWTTKVAAAAHAARVQGKLPGMFDRVFGEILDPEVDWSDKIEALFARKVGNSAYDFRKVDRRMVTRDIIAPGRSGRGADTVVIGVDTSGSINDRELDVFFAEMGGILSDIRPHRLLVAWCDANVHRVDEVYDANDLYALRSGKAPGGGGTSFRPVFEWLAEDGIEPDALVYLTDGYGRFPDKAPTYPVIWGSITPNHQFPFGDVVDVPIRER